MIPVLNTKQVREADRHTILHKPIRSIDLMESAAMAFCDKLVRMIPQKAQIVIFCGTGNNGGDGLAIGRLLQKQTFTVKVYAIGSLEKASDDFKLNFERLSELQWINEGEFPEIKPVDMVIDALFGTGLTRPIAGRHARLIEHINASGACIFSVDIASGLSADSPSEGNAIIRPTHTIAFEVPKQVYFHPESYPYVGAWHTVPIGLDQAFIQSQKTNYYLTELADIKPFLPKRKPYDHKGNAGRIGLVCGSSGKMGAAILAVRGAFRSGAGLVHAFLPASEMHLMPVAVPEAMTIPQEHFSYTDLSVFNSVGIGPGLGTDKNAEVLVGHLCKNYTSPWVIDADAINILSHRPDLFKAIPKQSILTPHIGEFKRLAGEWKDDFEKVEKLRSFCLKHGFNIALKGAYTMVCSSKGIIYFNPTGNPGMATAGSGDVLTGIITALTGQGLAPIDALTLGVYVHGLAGDMAKKKYGEISMKAGDIIEQLPSAFSAIYS